MPPPGTTDFGGPSACDDSNVIHIFITEHHEAKLCYPNDRSVGISMLDMGEGAFLNLKHRRT